MLKDYSRYETTRGGRRKSSRRMRRFGTLLLIFSTTILLLLRVATWLNAQEMFELKGILIEGNHFVKNSEILERLSVDLSKSLFELNLETIAAQAKSHPFVKQVSVSRRLPDNLVIRIVEKRPVALLNRGSLALVDESGDALPGFDSVHLLDYPLITGIGAQQKEALNEVLDFITFARKNDFLLYAGISEISYTEETGIFFFLDENMLPVIVGNGGFYDKCTKLASVMSVLRKGGKLAQTKSIDLRFEGRVVVKSRETT